MPIIKSAKKALRQSKRKNERNNTYRKQIREIKKDLEKNIKEAKTEIVNGLLVKFYKIADKAAKENIIHKNKAARLKSRLAKKASPKK